MDFYIKILNNKPVDHPITRENMITAFPELDLDNLPIGWAKFVRVDRPRLGPYEVAECLYEWDGDVIKDTWYIYPMSPEEKTAKQERVKKTWIEDGGFNDWVFDEESCTHKPPVPYPNDGAAYIWVQQAGAWVKVKLETPPADIQPVPYPLDGKEYVWNETNKNWVLKT
jgi:hypothetical protein